MISGQAFGVAQQLQPETLDVLNETLLASDSVILFRSSPSQKAQMVCLIKNHQKDKKLTLAIGDGFNDVNMIQEAHVGVGIRSVESN